MKRASALFLMCIGETQHITRKGRPWRHSEAALTGSGIETHQGPFVRMYFQRLLRRTRKYF